MILPASTLASLLLLILTLFCWATWANTQKLVYKWRFELFYYDFAVGVALCALIAVYFFGSANPQELTVSDNMFIAGYRKMAFALGAGLVINLANIMLVAAISVCGIAVTLPIVFGIGLIVMSITNYIGNPAGDNTAILFSGLLLLLGAVLADIAAYRGYIDAAYKKSKTLVLDPGTKLPVRPRRVAIGITLSIVSGIAWGFFFPLVDAGRSGDNGVGPYGIAGLIGVSIFFSTLLYVPFFLNFPVQGQPVQGRNYFTGTKKQHFWGIFGGMIWTLGLVAALAESAAPPSARTPVFLATLLTFGGPVLLTFCGLFLWREFKDSLQNVKLLHFGMLFLMVGGLVLVALAPVFVAK